MDANKFDLIVIGSGPAGEKGAAQAAYFGKRVALIEKEPVMGGAAANTGTLPSKTLRESALYLSGFKQRGLYGINFSLKDKVTAQDFLYRERLVVQTERIRIQENLKKHQVEVFNGLASFVDAHTIEVRPKHSEPVRLQADFFLIASGSHPFHPPNIPFHDSHVYDSDTILNLREIPATMLIAGGGVVGCEYACMFSALGIKVTLIEGRDRLLGFLDPEISHLLAAGMGAMGIELQMPDALESVEVGGKLQVRFKSGKEAAFNSILAATGRSGNTRDLGLEQLGIKINARGNIEVNEQYQTAQPHIYAAGDVIGFPALASTSMEQARLAMVHAFNLKYKERLAPILPYGIYTIPECSMAGETEETLLQKKIPYVVGRTFYKNNARGQIIGEKDGLLKLIFREEDMRLLGVHVIGEQASELVHIGVTALLMSATSDLFIQTCYNYPTLSEMYKYAAYDALGRRAQKGKIAPPGP